MDVDPRELTAGYVYPAGQGKAAAAGVLRDGRTVIWTCTAQPGHRLHMVPTLALQCAKAELDKRLQGGNTVLQLLHCTPCGTWWDVQVAGPDALAGLAAGRCPECGVRVTREKVMIIESEETR